MSRMGSMATSDCVFTLNVCIFKNGTERKRSKKHANEDVTCKCTLLHGRFLGIEININQKVSLFVLEIYPTIIGS